MTPDNELELFKQIDLLIYAESLGFVLDRAKSSATVKVVRREGEKLLIWEGHGGHWVYRNERDHNDSGSIVDFVMKQEGVNLGRARMTLRAFNGIAKPSLPPCPKERQRVASTGQDEGYRKKVAAVWNAARQEPEPTYLLGRGLSSLTLTDPRFADTFRVDRSGNVLFPHQDRVGMCGYELRRDGFKSFGSGCKKALWLSKNLSEAKSLYLCESAIDCMSLFQLYAGDSAYVSISGTPSALQRDLLTGLLGKAADRGVSVFTAFDNDQSGDEYTEIMELLSPVRLERVKPEGKDWNDDLLFVLREADL